jgi:hypothetical protein
MMGEVAAFLVILACKLFRHLATFLIVVMVIMVAAAHGRE